jgi:alginate O-acetyltransferase complex protein AlgI
MLFNSYSFIFLFLPITVMGYVAVNRFGARSASLGWLIACSIVFYGAWNPINLAIILPSIGINYLLASQIRRQIDRAEAGERMASLLLWAGIVFNIGFLGYFKYKNFFFESINQAFAAQLPIIEIALPLGISFITFQKIAFLVDVRGGAIRQFTLFDFLTFVFFFPQLIAGPIVHYREMMPQFQTIDKKLDAENLAVGCTLFAMGLFKKVVFADGIAAYVPAAFAATAHGQSVTFFASWMAALAYTFQIYFDFSGYTDMALGLARIFGIRLPMNFNSPLKSVSIIEFWSRWHITLTRFLTAYVYTPVVMRLTRARMQSGKPVLTRKKPTLEAFIVLAAWPTVLTMFLSGFWHGAGYTYLVWGLLHGGYLVVNHGWRQWRPKWPAATYERVMRPIGAILTFLAVVIAMVLFRASSLPSAARMLHGMTGMDGVSIPQPILTRLGGAGRLFEQLGVTADVTSGATFALATTWILVLFVIIVAAPNSLQLLRNYQPALYFSEPSGAAPAPQSTAASRLTSRPITVRWTHAWAGAVAAFFVFGALGLNRISEFLYWQF